MVLGVSFCPIAVSLETQIFHPGGKLLKTLDVERETKQLDILRQDFYIEEKQQNVLKGVDAFLPARKLKLREQTTHNSLRNFLKLAKLSRPFPPQAYRSSKICWDTQPEKVTSLKEGGATRTAGKRHCSTHELYAGHAVSSRFPAFVSCHPCFGGICHCFTVLSD